MKEKKQAVFVDDGTPCTVIVETPPARISHNFTGTSATIPHKQVRLESGEELTPVDVKSGLFKTGQTEKVVRIADL